MQHDPFESFISQLDFTGVPGGDDQVDQEELEQRDRLARIEQILETNEAETMPRASTAQLRSWEEASARTMRQYQLRFQPDSYCKGGPVYNLGGQHLHMLLMTAIAMANGGVDPHAMDLAANVFCQPFTREFDVSAKPFQMDALLWMMKQACYVYAQLWPQVVA